MNWFLFSINNGKNLKDKTLKSLHVIFWKTLTCHVAVKDLNICRGKHCSFYFPELFETKELMNDAILQQLQDDIAQLRTAFVQKERQRLGSTTVRIDDDVRAKYAPHLQIPPMETHIRKQIMASHPKVEPLPKVLKDSNGLATLGIQHQFMRNQISTKYPDHQRDALEIIRVIAGVYQRIRNQEVDSSELPKIFEDLLSIASDNAQRLAKAQLDASINARQQKGAMSLLDRDKFDFKDDNIIQSSHVQAISTLAKAKANIQKALPRSQTSSYQSQKPRSRGGGSRGRSNGYNGGRGGKRGRGGSRGRGRGRGQSNQDGYKADPNE